MESIARTLLRYLAGQGLIDRKAVVDGGLTVSISRSRNRFAVIRQKAGPSFFVKQALGELLGAQTVAREGEVYRRAYGEARMRPLRDLLPPFHVYDEAKGMLVTGFVAEAENLTFLHERLGQYPTGLARLTGTALAAIHGIRFAEGEPRPSCFAQKPHWILLLHGGGDLDHLRRSAAASEVIDLLLDAPGLSEHLGELRRSWARDTLIHADMRWENCLLAPKKQPLERRRLYFIDWELADIGDPSWDVGGILQAYLNCWIVSMPPTGASSPDELADRATRPLASIQPAIADFWDAYAESGARFGPSGTAFLERSVRMMAARMLVTGFEISMRGNSVDPRVILILQTALNVLERPAAAARDLLGIRISERVAPPAGIPRNRKVAVAPGPVRARHRRA